MSVVRIKRHRERFTVLSTATLRTAALSLKARGLWALCLSYPDDWEFRTGHLQAQSERDGRESVQSALKELETAGLASLETLRGKGGRVRGKRWTIYEEPSLNPSVSEDGGQRTEDGGQRARAPRSGKPVRRWGQPRNGKPGRRWGRMCTDGRVFRQTAHPKVGKTVGRRIRPYVIPSNTKDPHHERTSSKHGHEPPAVWPRAGSRRCGGW